MIHQSPERECNQWGKHQQLNFIVNQYYIGSSNSIPSCPLGSSCTTGLAWHSTEGVHLLCAERSDAEGEVELLHLGADAAGRLAAPGSGLLQIVFVTLKNCICENLPGVLPALPPSPSLRRCGPAGRLCSPWPWSSPHCRPQSYPYCSSRPLSSSSSRRRSATLDQIVFVSFENGICSENGLPWP
jgi:hypothetical protein